MAGDAPALRCAVPESCSAASDRVLRGKRMPLPALAQWDSRHVHLSAWDALSSGFGRDEPIPLWIDCDPGHDDAFALVLGAHHPRLRLLGVSTVDGNGSVENTTQNAARILKAAGVLGVQVHAGAAGPLLRRQQYYDCPSSGDEAASSAPAPHPEHIHGASGMELADSDGIWPDRSFGNELVSHKPAVPAMAEAIWNEYARLNPSAPLTRNQTVQTLKSGCAAGAISGTTSETDGTKDACSIRRRIKVVTCGPLTNVALLVSLYRELIPLIDVVVLGGALLAAGNVSPVAEFNIRHDPEAFHVVATAGIQHVVLIPLEVTHSVLAGEHVMRALQSVRSPFGRLMTGLLNYYSERYRRAFGFEAPPLHDPLAVAAVYGAAMGKFAIEHHRVDVELHEGTLCYGKIVVDVWGHTQRPRNVYVALAVDTEWFWSEMLAAVIRANDPSPL